MKFYKSILVISLLFLMISHYSVAQYKSHAANSFNYPAVPEQWEYSSQFNLLLAALPEDYIEEASDIIYAPLFQYAAKLGYKHGFSFRGSFSTNVVTYNLQLGPRWAFSYRRFAAQLGYDVSFLYGKLAQFGFDNEVMVWMNYPSIAFGFAFDNFTATFQTELSIITSAKQFTDNIEQASDHNLFNGISFTALVEQPFWSDNYLTIGVKLNYLRLYYPVWLVFPTWDRFSLTPEFIVGLKL